MSTRAARSQLAADRRAIANSMREAGATWAEVGEHFGVSAGRACQIAKPVRRAGNPHRETQPEPVGSWRERVERNADRVREHVRAVMAMAGAR